MSSTLHSPPAKTDDLCDAVLGPESRYEHGIVSQSLSSCEVAHVTRSEGGATVRQGLAIVALSV